jgi:ADP-heptose:LPS heptosyltransferase
MIMRVLISPYSRKLRDGENPKNYPYWTEVIILLKTLNIQVVQIMWTGDSVLPGVDEIVINPSVNTLKETLDSCNTFVTVDSFFQHFAAYHNRSGIVVWSKSDPNIFGYKHNENVYKSIEYFRNDQFGVWSGSDYDQAAFIEPYILFETIVRKLNIN